MTPPKLCVVCRLILVLLAPSFSARAGDDAELYRNSVSYSNNSTNKSYELVVRQSDVDAAPSWPDDQSSPPLAPGQAISIATEWVHKFFPETTHAPVAELAMKPVGHKGQWIYIATFQLTVQPGWALSANFPVVVLMNGHVVESKTKPNGERKVVASFSLKKAPVMQVLIMYRQLAGGPLSTPNLNTSKDVPLNAEVSIESEGGTRAETLRILEKALREQAGVVVTRAGSNQFSVTYDPTLRRAK